MPALIVKFYRDRLTVIVGHLWVPARCLRVRTSLLHVGEQHFYFFIVLIRASIRVQVSANPNQ